MKKYLVEVVSMYRMRYVVEAREEDHALDEVAMNLEVYNENWQEFSQKHIGDTIMSSREVDNEEILQMFDEDHDYLKNWHIEDKFSFINTIQYEDKEIVPDERDWAYDGLGNKVHKGTMKPYDSK